MRITAVFCAVLLLAGCSLAPRTTVDYSKPFQATYVIDTGGTKGMTHIASDGKGHVRWDCPWNGSYDSSAQPMTMSLSVQSTQMQAGVGMPWAMVDVVDANSHEMTSWVKGSGMNYFTRSKLSDRNQSDSALAAGSDMMMRFLENPSVNSKSAQAVGTKAVNGRPCHGYKTRQQMIEQHTLGFGRQSRVSRRTIEGGWQTEWIDDDTGILAKCDTEDSGMFGASHVELSEFSDKAPDPSVFQPPKDYTEGSPTEGNIAMNGNVKLNVSGMPSGSQSVPGVGQGQSISMSMSVGKPVQGSTNQQAPVSQEPEPFVDKRPLRQLTDVVAQEKDYLSTLSDFTNAEIDHYMVRYQDTAPLGHTTRGYSIVAPKDWHNTPVKEPEQSFAKLPGKYWQLLQLDGNSPNTSLEIWYGKPPAEETLTLSTFLEGFCKSSGMTIVQQKEGANRIDALAEYDLPKIGKMTARLACVQLDGKRVWMAAGCAPKSEFPRVANVFCVAGSTFSPIGYNPTYHPTLASKNIDTTPSGE
jgi:hypothetical protein